VRGALSHVHPYRNSRTCPIHNRARWRDDLGAWFVPGATAERRLRAWSSREWSGVLAYADERGRDALAFDPIVSPYLEVAGDLVARTPYSRAVVTELRMVPWARWDPTSKAWRVPFRSFEELRRRWPDIEAATRRAEPEERRKREQNRRASPEHGVGWPRPPNADEIGIPCRKTRCRRSSAC
jgi:hypothetical protein